MGRRTLRLAAVACLVTAVGVAAAAAGQAATGRAATGSAGAPADRSVRVVRAVAIDDRFELDDYASYATFDAEVRRLFDLARPHLVDDRVNLVVYPESIGLWTAFLGPRGAVARDAGSPEEAIGSLLASHQPQIALSSARFGTPPVDPGLLPDAARALDLRTLAWALADPMTRAMHEAFSRLARDEGVWLVSCSDQAPAEPDDAPAVQALRDPQAPSGSPTYVTPTDQPYFHNLCWVWDPTGEVVYEAHKEYLVALEQDLLDITAESVDAIGVAPTPAGRLGFTISAPAWAHEVTQRLEQLDMHVQLQPDANPGAVGGYGWANAPASLDNWQPDGWRMASWEQLSLSGSVQANVTPMATGTVLDFVMFDGQGHLMHQPRPADQPRAFVGSPGEPGFAAIAPWLDAVRDWCPRDDPEAPLLARRQRLVACSAQLEPGAPHQGEEVEGVVAADLVLRERPAGTAEPDACAVCVAVAPRDARQWTPDVATTPDGTLHAVWRDGSTTWDGVHADGDILAARSTDGGASWSKPVRVDDGPAPSNRPDDGAWHPEIVATSDGTLVVAYEDARESENVWAARSTDDGATWSPSVRVSTTGGAPTNGGARNGYHDLAAGPDGTVVLVYHGHAMANSAARVYASVSRDRGATWSEPVVVDDTPVRVVHEDGDVAVVHGDGHAWRPAVTWRGSDVVVAWQDFRTRQNVLRAVVAPVDRLGAVGSTVVDPEALGRTWSDGHTTEWAQQLTPALAADGDTVRLAWEDTRDGVGHVRTARLHCAAGLCGWRDDRAASPPGGARERFPDLTAGGWVAWEREAGAQAWQVDRARLRDGHTGPAEALGAGLAPALGPTGAVLLQVTTGWAAGEPRPATEQVVAAPAPKPPPTPPLPATGAGPAGALVGALALALAATTRRRTRCDDRSD